jgi:hypothetical protein
MTRLAAQRDQPADDEARALLIRLTTKTDPAPAAQRSPSRASRSSRSSDSSRSVSSASMLSRDVVPAREPASSRSRGVSSASTRALRARHRGWIADSLTEIPLASTGPPAPRVIATAAHGVRPRGLPARRRRDIPCVRGGHRALAQHVEREPVAPRLPFFHACRALRKSSGR